MGAAGLPPTALRLHEAATVVVERHRGEVPATYEQLRSLPGVGPYTAAAVASFAYGQRHAVVDTNVRRVLTRVLRGGAHGPAAQTAAVTRLANALVPDDARSAAGWAVAVMELGAVVCTARAPGCGDCPLAGRCAWRRAGSPGAVATPRRGQRYAGTDRQVRGLLLAVLRAAALPVDADALATMWPTDPAQQARALDGLVADGLVESLADGRYRLPGT